MKNKRERSKTGGGLQLCNQLDSPDSWPRNPGSPWSRPFSDPRPARPGRAPPFEAAAFPRRRRRSARGCRRRRGPSFLLLLLLLFWGSSPAALGLSGSNLRGLGSLLALGAATSGAPRRPRARTVLYAIAVRRGLDGRRGRI